MISRMSCGVPGGMNLYGRIDTGYMQIFTPDIHQPKVSKFRALQTWKWIRNRNRIFAKGSVMNVQVYDRTTRASAPHGDMILQLGE